MHNFEVVSPTLTLTLSESGEIIHPFTGRTILDGCQQVGEILAKSLVGGGCEFTRTVADGQPGNRDRPLGAIGG